MDVIRVEPPSSIKINSLGVNPPARALGQAVVETGTQPDDDTSRDRDEVGKESLGAGAGAQRPDTEVELCDHKDKAPGHTPPRGNGEGPGLPGQFVHGAALDLPGVAHADVGEADHAPAEEGDERGEIGEPGEDGRTGGVDVKESEATANDEGWDESPPRTTSLVGCLHLLYFKSVSIKLS